MKFSDEFTASTELDMLELEPSSIKHGNSFAGASNLMMFVI